MMSRITLILLAAFWLTMSYLLWRSEYVGHDQPGGNIPVQVIWRKILTSQDSSRLEIFHGGGRVGNCSWTTTVGQQAADGSGITEDVVPEGMVRLPKRRAVGGS